MKGFHAGPILLLCGDNRDVLREIPTGSVDSILTDPPYALVSASSKSGFMGKSWDTGETAFSREFWRECYRVLKPGGFVVAFGGTRTFHRLAYAIEDAGFHVRDMLAWLYGSGFPKSHNVSKGIDKAAGHAEDRGYIETTGGLHGGTGNTVGTYTGRQLSDVPFSDAAKQWDGWGTALKPALEPICLARKPLIGTVAANVLTHGTGAINVDGCRIETDELKSGVVAAGKNSTVNIAGRKEYIYDGSKGRWPANICHDGSEEVLTAFPDSSAARFFYSAKADAEDRFASKHPTVKPVGLMQWLCRLVTPPRGLILDPFAGSGTTGEAARREGFSCIMIEREEEYIKDIVRRMKACDAGPAEKKRALTKARGELQDASNLPLFGSSPANDNAPPKREEPDRGGNDEAA